MSYVIPFVLAIAGADSLEGSFLLATLEHVDFGTCAGGKTGVKVCSDMPDLALHIKLR